MAPGDRWVYRETGDGAESRVGHRHAGHKDDHGHQGTRRPRHRHGERIGHGGHVRLVRQDADGNLWYLGEDTKEYENGKLKTTEGSGRPASTAPSPG